MDIIPIIPAPQQGISPDPVELSAGDDTTGFDLLLNQELAAGEQSDKPSSKIETPNQKNNLEYDIGVISDDQEVGDAHLVNGQLSTFNQSAASRTDQAADSKIIDGTAISQPSETLSSDALSPISQDSLRTHYGQENLLRDFINLSTLLSHHVQPQTGLAVQTPGNQGENAAKLPRTTLQLHSTAAAFSVQSRDAVHTIALQQATIVSDGTLTSPFDSISGTTMRADYTISSASGIQGQPSALTSSIQEIPVSAPDQISTKSTGIQNGAVLIKTPHALPLSSHSVPHDDVSIMFEQLQKLVNLNNDKVTMHVSTADRVTTDRSIGNLAPPPRVEIAEPPVNAMAEATNISSAVLTKSTESIANRSPQASSALNRNGAIETVQEQLPNSRATGLDINKEQDNSPSSQQNKNSSQGNSVPQQQTAAATTGATAAASEQPPNSSTFNAQFQDISANNGGETVKPGSSPTAPMSYVRDQEIINQIVDRFSIQSRLQTTRLSIQLNPAELGELKIEVIVKGDVLKANIYAQTHQASEIIDRNLPRLREILQGQGISVDELVVSFNSDTIDNFSSQHGQLFQDHNNQLENRSNSQTSKRFDNTIEEMLLSETENQSGVNLKI